MKYIFLALIVTGLLPAGSVNSHPVFVPAEKDSISASRIMGTSDYLWQTGWSYMSLDRISIRPHSGYYGFYGPQPAYLLDGLPFDPVFMGMAYSQLFPVTYHLSQEVGVFEGYGIRHGVPYTSGLIEINSRPPKTGVSVFGSGQYGHYGGEPGPWVFDPDRVTPNVERFGPWINGGLSLKYGDWYARGWLKHQEYIHVDEFVQLRMRNLRQSPTDETRWLGVETQSTLGFAETGMDTERIKLKIRGIRGEGEDFLFFQPLAREVPTDFGTIQYSALGKFYLHPKAGVRTVLQQAEKKLLYRENIFEHHFRWDRKTRSGRGSLFFEGSRFEAEAGAALEKKAISAEGLPGDEQTLTSVFAEQAVSPIHSLRLNTSAQICFLNDERALQADAELEFQITPEWTITAGAVYNELFPGQAHPTERSVQNGYYIFDHLGIESIMPDPIENTRLTAFRHSHTFRFSGSFGGELRLQYIRHLSLNIPFQRAGYELAFSTVPGIFTLHGSESGERLLADLFLRYRMFDGFTHTATVTMRRTVNGSTHYRDYWQMAPGFLTQYSMNYQSFPDLEIAVNIQYRTSSTWTEFEQLDGEINRTFHIQYPFKYFEFSDTLPSHLNIDLKFAKWFWEQRIRGTLLLKNLLNSDYQTHPLGIRERFGYMARMEFRF